MSTISASTTTTTAYKVAADTTGTLVLQTGATPTTAMTIDGSQNVGVGTSSPGKKLQLDGGNAYTAAMRFSYGASAPTYYADWGYKSDGNKVYLTITDSGTAKDVFCADYNGNFLLGTTSSATVNKGMKIIGGTSTSSSDYTFYSEFSNGTQAFGLRNDGAVYATGNLLVGITSAGANKFIVSTDGVRGHFYVNSSGNVGAYSLGTGALYSNAGILTNTNPSDSRLKTDVQDLSWGLSQILALRPVSYAWKNNPTNQGTQYGFIAQEVQSVMPELVREFETTDGEETVTCFGLEKEGIYAALVKAIQEQQALITQLQADVAALKGA